MIDKVKQILAFQLVAQVADKVKSIPDEIFTLLTAPMNNLAGDDITMAPKSVQESHERLIKVGKLLYQLKKELEKNYGCDN